MVRHCWQQIIIGPPSQSQIHQVFMQIRTCWMWYSKLKLGPPYFLFISRFGNRNLAIHFWFPHIYHCFDYVALLRQTTITTNFTFKSSSIWALSNVLCFKKTLNDVLYRGQKLNGPKRVRVWRLVHSGMWAVPVFSTDRSAFISCSSAF